MIFVTAGLQLEFTRLFDAVYAIQNELGEDLVFQCEDRDGKYPNASCQLSYHPNDFKRFVSISNLVVCHAGIGSILSCVACDTSFIVMPRDADKGEHRNQHQMATCRSLESSKGLNVAWDEIQLQRKLLDHFYGKASLAIDYASREVLQNSVSEWLKE